MDIDMEKLRTVEEVASFFDVTPKTIYCWIDDGCPAKKIIFKGRRRQYKLKIGDVLAFTEQEQLKHD